MTDIEIAIMIKNMAQETVRRMTVKNDDAPKFDSAGYLLDKNGRPFFVHNGTTADLIVRKYKEMEINLQAEKDRTGSWYFKK